MLVRAIAQNTPESTSNKMVIEKKHCLFCDISQERIIAENSLAYVVRDAYPVTSMHSLIVPKHHTASYFDLYKLELEACNELIREQSNKVKLEDETVSGFNIGVNIGDSAGQTVFHCHIHLIPRRDDDVENPRGGVRSVIPARQDYTNEKNLWMWKK